MKPARNNPFRVECVQTFRTRLYGISWPQLIHRLYRCGGRGAIVGPHGSGKTTLLHDLGDRLEAAGLHVQRVRTDNRRPLRRSDLALLRDGDCLLLDARPMSPLKWMALLAHTRRCAAVVITAHRPTPLPTLYQTRPRPEVLAEMIHALCSCTVTPRFTTAVLNRHRGNFRDALAECYDRWSSGTLP